MEKIMKNPLIEHAEEHNLFGDNQHGFRGSRSTTSNILIHHEKILKQQEEGKSVDTNYVDLSKAFDKVGRAKLIWKLRKQVTMEDYYTSSTTFLETEPKEY